LGRFAVEGSQSVADQAQRDRLGTIRNRDPSRCCLQALHDRSSTALPTGSNDEMTLSSGNVP